ncbi:hypothetical protein HLRTI_001309 [Halorhabdus tiamatea SARL4B]|uniref:Uncharacterized protein n=1 Tax=Halorhabdus tiamatea SARL4B TaxID=1033806 RepID=U2E2U6_9EURY|nr:hypothetical protein HLRTI_001309 [Halorhabdus tiamatea SARL4B]
MTLPTIVQREVNGCGPYAYRVTYAGDGEQDWEYLGRVDELPTSLFVEDVDGDCEEVA